MVLCRYLCAAPSIIQVRGTTVCPGFGPEIEAGYHSTCAIDYHPSPSMKILEVLTGLALLGPAKLTWKWFQGEADKQISELTPSNTSRLSGGLVGTASPLQGTTTS